MDKDVAVGFLAFIGLIGATSINYTAAMAGFLSGMAFMAAFRKTGEKTDD